MKCLLKMKWILTLLERRRRIERRERDLVSSIHTSCLKLIKVCVSHLETLLYDLNFFDSMCDLNFRRRRKTLIRYFQMQNGFSSSGQNSWVLEPSQNQQISRAMLAEKMSSNVFFNIFRRNLIESLLTSVLKKRRELHALWENSRHLNSFLLEFIYSVLIS